MARSINCLKCRFSGNLRGQAVRDWRTDLTCDHLLMTGCKSEKGDDPDNCLLFEPKTSLTQRDKFFSIGKGYRNG